jgi:Raf kinase inhibitor-like YbhB/YbcL family protein
MTMALKRLVLAALSVFAAALAVSAASAFELKSADVAPGGAIAEKFIFKGFGCTGGNVSPELSWSDAPEGTKSFAVLMHDPDAPTGGAGFWHWFVANIPATAKGLPQGVSVDGAGLPAGSVQISTDFGAPGYGGPCPPQGDKPHHYHFTVYALKVEKIDFPPHATASLAGFLVNANSLGKATLTGMFGR